MAEEYSRPGIDGQSFQLNLNKESFNNPIIDPQTGSYKWTWGTGVVSTGTSTNIQAGPTLQSYSYLIFDVSEDYKYLEDLKADLEELLPRTRKIKLQDFTKYYTGPKESESPYERMEKIISKIDNTLKNRPKDEGKL